MIFTVTESRSSGSQTRGAAGAGSHRVTFAPALSVPAPVPVTVSPSVTVGPATVLVHVYVQDSATSRTASLLPLSVISGVLQPVATVSVGLVSAESPSLVSTNV